MYDYEFESRRPRWLLFGAAGLAAMVLLVAGFGIGRASAPWSSTTQSATVATSSGPGPTRLVNGVPVGYAHTQDGAVAAATNFLVVKDGPLITQPDRYRAAIEMMAAPDVQKDLRAAAEKSLEAFQSTAGLISDAQQGRTVVFRTIPLAYHLDRYAATSAEITIWSEALVGADGSLAVRGAWATVPYSVEWVDGDWRLNTVGTASDGPVPIVAQPSVQSSQLPPELTEFRTYSYGLA